MMYAETEPDLNEPEPPFDIDPERLEEPETDEEDFTAYNCINVTYHCNVFRSDEDCPHNSDRGLSDEGTR